MSFASLTLRGTRSRGCVMCLLMLMVAADAAIAKDPGKPLRLTAGEPPLWGLWLMGQSLCDGSESLPVITSGDTGWGNVAFKRGVRTWVAGDHDARPEYRPADQFVFVPLTAKENGGLGETMANGLADHLKISVLKGTDMKGSPHFLVARRGSSHRMAGDQDALSEDDLGPVEAWKKAEAPRFLVAYAGQGGRMIEELSIADESTDPRTPAGKLGAGGFYKTSLDDARRAVKQARAQGRSFAIAALVWMQGEANGGPTGGINPSRWEAELPRPAGQEWYRDHLMAYRKQWAHDLRAITGQKGEIPMFTYQTLGPAGEAQVMAADSDPNIYMVGPHYMVPSAINSRRAGRHGDAIHLAADGERWYGEQVGKVVRRVLQEGEAWQPLRLRKAWIDPARTSVLMDFAVPRPPLVLDEAFLPREQTEVSGGFNSLRGFQIRNAAGGVPLIRSVEIESPTQVRVRLAAPLPAGTGYTMSYGLPYAGKVGVVTGIRPGPVIKNQPTSELVVQGNLEAPLRLLIDEGAFWVANTQAGVAYAQAPVRWVMVEKGTTVLRYEDRERRNKTDFAVGQTLDALRPFAYGNLRDSDSERALYSFTDTAYGRRAGQPYRLWNWCLLSSRFPIAEGSK